MSACTYIRPTVEICERRMMMSEPQYTYVRRDWVINNSVPYCRKQLIETWTNATRQLTTHYQPHYLVQILSLVSFHGTASEQAYCMLDVIACGPACKLICQHPSDWRTVHYYYYYYYHHHHHHHHMCIYSAPINCRCYKDIVGTAARNPRLLRPPDWSSVGPRAPDQVRPT